ncbi:MAG: HutD family protein, partial [Oscillospiraceae bacterium]
IVKSFSTSLWSGGSTTQLAIYPPQAVYANRDFIWRISSATVEDEFSTFTPLPDYNRIISVISGKVRLQHLDREVLVSRGMTHFFDGGESTECFGRCTDFNLMMKKGLCQGSMDFVTIHCSKPVALHSNDAMATGAHCTCAVFALDESISISFGGSITRCPSQSLALLENCTDVLLTAEKSANAFVCFIYC